MSRRQPTNKMRSGLGGNGLDGRHDFINESLTV